MIQIVRRNLFRALKTIIYGGWPERHLLADGYTMLLPIPADMPFLLQFALEGLRRLKLPNCKEILVISDGSANDRALRAIVLNSRNALVRHVSLNQTDKILMNLPRSDGSANYRHFTQILRGVLAATTDAIYLHDADAFWLEEAGVEVQYREFRQREMYALGLTRRIDPMFIERGFDIPGTWELMFSNAWVRKRPPIDMKGGWYPVPGDDWQWFDTLLYAQYMDFASGRIGLMAEAPRFVHFYGTITEYRLWQRAKAKGATTEDRLFALLLLSTLAESIPGGRGDLPLPPPHELARGLSEPSAAITYVAASAPERYASFRSGLEDLYSSSMFGNDVSRRIRDSVAPFDEHFLPPRTVLASARKTNA